MPDFLTSTITDKTALPSRFREAASWQSMDAYLVDWHRAQLRLNRQIAALTTLRDERRDAADRGEWPPVDSGHAETPGSSVGNDRNGTPEADR